MATVSSIGLQSCANDTDTVKLTYLRAAHTISQRLRTLKKIPPELMPLGKLGLSTDYKNIFADTSSNDRCCTWVGSLDPY